jgi:hypothetical protein
MFCNTIEFVADPGASLLECLQRCHGVLADLGASASPTLCANAPKCRSIMTIIRLAALRY